ncbi:hypothetical protein B0I32_117214 [Nonomuraea fuscirosea]|uniref:Uncharacterized protein n=1 Tax=Nonomuraea fuscirosea TaxID=1291556 RepID=A0A2T0MQS4_9ACTN|nr:hypothetical protein B0I32_117214 [Nonomuraea fuscirosea]
MDWPLAIVLVAVIIAVMVIITSLIARPKQ